MSKRAIDRTDQWLFLLLSYIKLTNNNKKSIQYINSKNEWRIDQKIAKFK